MGFHVSTLHNLPSGHIKHFVHVLDMSQGAHGRWIADNLLSLAKEFGPNAGLVTGTADLSNELYKFLANNVAESFGAVENLLHSATCLVVSEGHLASTNSPVYLLPLSPPEESPAAQEMIQVLISMLAAAIKDERLDELLNSLGARQLSLTSAGGGFIVCTLREANKVLELKPNIAGLGVNLNALIERILPPEVRTA
jgi:hypothetical protein